MLLGDFIILILLIQFNIYLAKHCAKPGTKPDIVLQVYFSDHRRISIPFATGISDRKER